MSESRSTSPANLSVPPVLLVIIAICSLQVGSALAYTLFPAYGTLGTLFLRMLLGGLVLCLLYRSALLTAMRRAPFAVLLLGVTITAQSGAFYEAIARIPLGAAVAIEFVGPLAVALAASRQWPDILSMILAATAVVLLTPAGSPGVDPVGVLFALAAAAGWACFIVASRQLGDSIDSGAGIALSMIIAALILAPSEALSAAGVAMAQPATLGVVAAIAVFSAALPYSCELLALKSIPPRQFGVLVAGEPVLAGLVAILVLGEHLDVIGWIAVLLVVTAAAVTAIRGKAAAETAPN